MTDSTATTPLQRHGHDDVDVPPAGLAPLLSTVYGVAAGFKLYRILDTHGFDANTRVVFFDYSPRALEFRQLLLREWDGRDYPRFLRAAARGWFTSDTRYGNLMGFRVGRTLTP